jgi:hypothetical protein
MNQQVALDRGGGGRHAPRATHGSPGERESPPDLLDLGDGAAGFGNVVLDSTRFSGHIRYRMVTSSATLDRELRPRGALLAAAICLAWIAAGGIGWALLLPINSAVAAVPALVGLGGLAALVPFTFLGWHYAPLAVTSRTTSLRMTTWVVLMSDLMVVLAALVAAASAALTNYVERSLVDLGVDIFWGAATGVAGGMLLYVLGLLIFGLPSLLLAIPSSLYWERVMRRASQQ